MVDYLNYSNISIQIKLDICQVIIKSLSVTFVITWLLLSVSAVQMMYAIIAKSVTFLYIEKN